MQSLYFRLFSHLGINNKCITKEWRILPKRYQGLGLLNFIVIAFSKKVFFIQCHWGSSDAPGSMLKWAYKHFVVEVGLQNQASNNIELINYPA